MTTEQIKSKIANILTVMGLELIPEFDQKLCSFIDSLEVVELVINVEQQFEIGITNDEIEELETLNDLVQLVSERISH